MSEGDVMDVIEHCPERVAGLALRQRLHAVRAELDALAIDIKAHEDSIVHTEGMDWGWAWWDARRFVDRAGVAVTSADKALAKGEDPRDPSSLAPLKRKRRNVRMP